MAEAVLVPLSGVMPPVATDQIAQRLKLTNDILGTGMPLGLTV